MFRNRVSWGIGLMALLLTLGMAACGGAEPAPVVQPPAPPPAPPPFQPQAVEVALGESGNITFMTTADGGFTLSGEKFESGGTVAAENGNMYVLNLADGTWAAVYQAMEEMVTLGITEEVVTLTKAEDGTYWLGDDLVTSGETTATATNGNMYTLSMNEEGMWMAAYQKVMVSVGLGITGEMASLVRAEDGTYWLGDALVTSGMTTTMSMNGNEYTLMMDADGMWTALYIEPVQAVMLGEHGGSVMIKKSEDGSYWIGDVTVANGSTVMVGNNTYELMMDADGMWMAAYQQVMVSVTLGITGEMVSLVRAEDGTYWLGDALVTSGMTTTMSMNGNEYRLMMGEDGMWMAHYVPAMGTVAVGGSGIAVSAMRDEAGNWSAVHPQTQETIALTEGGMLTAVNLAGYTNTYTLSSDGAGTWTASYVAVSTAVVLGTSGSSAMLVRAEDGSYGLGEDAVLSGDSTLADNGNRYILTMVNGAWSSAFDPDMMEIKGAGINVYTREDDDMYDIGTAGSDVTLASTGAGDITWEGAMYRVRMMDSMLVGTRIDTAVVEDTAHITVGLSALPTYIGDDRDTEENEANTMIVVAGEEISLGALFGPTGAAKPAKESDGLAGEFVQAAVDLLMDLRTEAELYAKYQAASETPTEEFDDRLDTIAGRAQDAVDMIFGNIGPGNKKVDVIADDVLPMDGDEEGDYVRATQTVRGLNTLLDALSSADAFVDATEEGNNGVFEDTLGEDAARDAFSANMSEYAVHFRYTENTRYGAITLKQRLSADPDLTADTDDGADAEAAAIYGTRFAFDGTPDDDDNEDVGAVGAFAYSRINDTLRSRNLPQTGSAKYTGGTLAVTPGGTLFSGDMRIDVNFRQQTVFGQVSNLRDKDNSLWQYLDADVDTIYLPSQTYGSLTQFGGVYDTDDGTDGVQAPSEDVQRTGLGDFGTATVVYAAAQGFASPTQQDTKARFAGRFIGPDGAEITGTWSLGQSVEGDNRATKSNDLDVLYGSYGVTREGDAMQPVTQLDPTVGGAIKAVVMSDGSTIQGDKDLAAILRLGKASTGGDKSANNDFALTTIFNEAGADPKKTVNKSITHVQTVVAHIMQQRAIYVIYAEQVGGDSDDRTDLANAGRQNAWMSINDFVLDHIFNVELAEIDS